ncbi:MAG: DUF3276 family protein, partial [Bacteroidota bacterium]
MSEKILASVLALLGPSASRAIRAPTRSFAPSPTVPLMDDRRRRFEDEVFSKRVRAGKRSYFFDVKPTRSGQD